MEERKCTCIKSVFVLIGVGTGDTSTDVTLLDVCKTREAAEASLTGFWKRNQYQDDGMYLRKVEQRTDPCWHGPFCIASWSIPMLRPKVLNWWTYNSAYSEDDISYDDMWQIIELSLDEERV